MYSYTSQSLFLEGGTIDSPRPFLDVKFIAPATTIDLVGLIDSGTDATLIDSEIAKELFISSNTCRKVYLRGVGQRLGGVPDSIGFAYTLQAKFGGFDEVFNVPVIFADKLPYPVLLGQKGFFEYFDVKFRKRKDIFELTKI